MDKLPQQLQRKSEHLFLAEKFYSTNSHNFPFKILKSSLPEMNISDVDLSTTIFNKKIAYPIYINAMTGGSQNTLKINDKLSRLSSELNIPMAVGSMSSFLKYGDIAGVKESYAIVRKNNPKGLIFANISAKYSIDDVNNIIDFMSADALQIHVNVLQELAMAEGDREFKWLNNIEKIVKESPVPVVIKEVGTGMDRSSIKKLIDIGVTNIDVSGQGGTNFINIENERNKDDNMDYLNEFSLTTAESLIEASYFKNVATIFSSGGIKSPVDVIKSLYLGAEYVGIAGYFLHLVQKNNYEDAVDQAHNFLKNIDFSMTAIGARDIDELRNKDAVYDINFKNYINQRN